MKKRRWISLEFLLYYAFAVHFYWHVISVSTDMSNKFMKDEWRPWFPGLVDGWLLGRKIDLSDSQWSTFRSGLVTMTILYSTLTLAAQFVVRWSSLVDRRGPLAAFWLVSSLLFCTYLHGTCIVFILFIGTFNFFLTMAIGGRKGFPIAFWLFHCITFALIRQYEGFRFSSFSPMLQVMDNYRGVFRWHICYNLVMLRMISFGMDYHWASSDTKALSIGSQKFSASSFDRQRHKERCETCRKDLTCYLVHQQTALGSSEYNSLSYFCYILFAPLYIAGPIVSFNAFASQLQNPQKTHSKQDIFTYGLRLVACLFLMELLTHFCYYSAIVKSKLWQNMGVLEVCILSYGALNFTWLKFLIIWRYFRFWSLVNGVECPENVLRCINNNYDIEGFWRSWHASYNKWIIRYLYIPLGGSTWKMANVWVVFTFVALWHDLEWKLLFWAWLSSLLCAPELLVKAYFSSPSKQAFRETLTYRELCAVGGAFNVLGLMIANIIGFILGASGIIPFLQRMLAKHNIGLLMYIWLAMYIGVKFMLEIRDGEKGTTSHASKIDGPVEVAFSGHGEKKE